MPYEKGGGRQCCVVDCSNNEKRLYTWKNSVCGSHNGLLCKDCPCLAPFKFHCVPSAGVNRLEWLKSINRKDFNPASKAVVSFLITNSLHISNINVN